MSAGDDLTVLLGDGGCSCEGCECCRRGAPTVEGEGVEGERRKSDGR
jgi:hypothetical protein